MENGVGSKTTHSERVLAWALVAAIAVVAIIWLIVRLRADSKVSSQSSASIAVATTAPAPVTAAVVTAPGSTAPPTTRAAATTVVAAAATCPNPDGTSPKTQAFATAFPLCIDATKRYVVTIETTQGAYKAELDAVKAPLTVNNFVSLARYHYFDDTACHRVIKGFMAQCGDPTATGRGGPGYSFKDELPASSKEYTPGTLAMANSGPNTNGSQFFTMFRNELQPNYTIFGHVTEGLDTTIAALNAVGNPNDGAPTTPVKILKVTVVETAK